MGSLHHLSDSDPMLTRSLIAGCVAAFAVVGFAGDLQAGQGRALRAPSANLRPVQTVYLEGVLVKWQPEKAAKRQTLLHAGPWLIGPRTKDKPRDGRLNLYIVTPGTQRHDDEVPDWDHNLIINALPRKEDSVAEWDVYVAIVLDPALQQDIRTERELILARQQSFMPGEDFDFSNIPGQAFLRQFLKFESLSDLEGFRRSDGTLPRLVMVPAGAMIRATAAPIETDPVQTQSAAEVPPAAAGKPKSENNTNKTEQSPEKNETPPQ